MFAPYHSSSFYFTPVSKGLLGTLVLSSLAFSIPLNAYRYWLSYSFTNLSEGQWVHELLRFLACRCVFLDPKDLICSLLLLYQFRLFERRYGSRKFALCCDLWSVFFVHQHLLTHLAKQLFITRGNTWCGLLKKTLIWLLLKSHLLGTWVIAGCFELLAVYVCQRLELPYDDDPLPCGPFGMVYGFFVPYFCDIPRVAVTHILHIPVTGKSLVYIIGLQMASSSSESLLVAISGIVAGLIYHHNILKIQSLFQIPRLLGCLGSSTVGWLVNTGPPPEQTEPMGATLEIQRQQQLQQLEQQMAWAQINRPPIGNLGFGLFGNNRHNYNNGNQQLPPSEDQVRQLVDMGFSRERVLHALQVTNNDVTMATTVLLHQS